MIRPAIPHLSTVLVVGALAAGASACGDDDTDQPANAGSGEAQTTTTTGGTSTEAPTRIDGGVTTLRLDDRVATVFDAAGIELGPDGAATRARGALRFPISEGEIDIDTPSGRLEHRGGIRFAAGGAEVTADQLVLEPKTGNVTAEVAGRRIPLLTVDLRRPEVPPTGDTIVWGGPASLSQDAASALNDRLGVDVLRQGLQLGQLQVSAERR